MHDNPTEYLDQERPACTACGRDLWTSEAGRYLCRPCETKTGSRLAELAELWPQIDNTEVLEHGARRPGAGGSGGSQAPVPLRVAPLSLATAGGVATRLAAIEDSWRAALSWTVAPWRGSPRQAVPEHIRFLQNNLPWAAGDYESVDQDVEELRRLLAECRAALTTQPRPGSVKAGQCPNPGADLIPCGAQLTVRSDELKITCRSCGATWAGRAELQELRLAQLRIEQADVAGLIPGEILPDHLVVRCSVTVRGTPYTVVGQVPRSLWEHPPARAAFAEDLQGRLGRAIAEQLKPVVTVIADTGAAELALADLTDALAAQAATPPASNDA